MTSIYDAKLFSPDIDDSFNRIDTNYYVVPDTYTDNGSGRTMITSWTVQFWPDDIGLPTRIIRRLRTVHDAMRYVTRELAPAGWEYE